MSSTPTYPMASPYQQHPYYPPYPMPPPYCMPPSIPHYFQQPPQYQQHQQQQYQPQLFKPSSSPSNSASKLNYQVSGRQQVIADLRKSPIKQRTYFDLLKNQLQEYEQKHTMVTMQQQTIEGQSYTLYEDLKILIEVSMADNFVQKYKEIANDKIVNRSYEGIKSRHNHYLKSLREQDLNQIYQYTTLHGLDGYLVFEKCEETGKKVLKTVQSFDPRQHASNAIKQKQNEQQQQQQTQQRKSSFQIAQMQYQQQQKQKVPNLAMQNLALKRQPLKIEDTSDNEEGNNVQFQPQVNKKSQNQQGQVKQSVAKKEIQQIEKSAHHKKKLKTPAKMTDLIQGIEQLHNREGGEVQNKKHTALEGLSKNEQIDAQELDVVLTVLGNWFQIQKKILIQQLSELSGDLSLLDKYLETKDELMLWKPEDDELLKKSLQELEEQQIKMAEREGNLDALEDKEIPVPTYIRTLIKYKGAYSVQKRIEFLQLDSNLTLMEK